MRVFLVCIAALTLAIFVQGCANQPLPQDFTGSNTADIVARIRCETRDAIRLAAIKEIETYRDVVLYKNQTGAQLGAWLREDPNRFNLLGAPRFKNKEIDKAFEYFRKAQVGYEFTLNLNESNTQGVNLDLVRTFARRIDTIGIGAKGERTRQTIRRFTVIDNFLVLATSVYLDYCADPRPINLVYPTEGRLKIFDLIDNFIFINKNGSFKGTPTGPAIQSMNDTIIFSTKFSGNISPNFTLNPTQLYGFELSKFSVTNDNFREDRHQVIITATLPNVKDFPYYSGNNFLDFKSNDPRILAADNSIQQTRKNNVEDAIIAIANNTSRLFVP